MWQLGHDEPVEPLDKLPQFDADRCGFNFNLDGDIDELFFFQLFITDNLITDITYQTNLCYSQVIADKQLPQYSRFSKFQYLTEGKICAFIAPIDSVFATPFVCSVMPRGECKNILSVFHLCDNTTYPKKGKDRYDPRKKLEKLFTTLTDLFLELWIPSQNLSIDEGCIAFKGRINFKWYNANETDKYHIKSYKVVDSSNNYCLRFDIYVGDIREQALTDYGKTRDLVMRLCQPYPAVTSFTWTITTHLRYCFTTY